MVATFPAARPARMSFSCGPCAKHLGWQLQNLQDAPFGRSHRAKASEAKLKLAIALDPRDFASSARISNWYCPWLGYRGGRNGDLVLARPTWRPMYLPGNPSALMSESLSGGEWEAQGERHVRLFAPHLPVAPYHSGDRRWRGAGGSHGHQPRQGAALFPDPVGAHDLTKRLGSANPWGRTAFNRTDNILWQHGRFRTAI